MTEDSNFQPSAVSQPPVLHPWDEGPFVAELQELLNAQGYSLRIDGDYGSRTETAVKVYQKRQGLRIDGIVGRQTWLSLKTTVKPGSRTLRQGRSGIDVMELQGLLQICGCYVRRDGFFGVETTEAIMQFQQQHHLHPDGVVNAVIWTLLRGRKPPSKASPQNPRRKFRL